MKINNAIDILTVLIIDAENNSHVQHIDFYKSAVRVLQRKTLNNAELENLHRNFCGYLANGYFHNNEYQNILKLIELLK